MKVIILFSGGLDSTGVVYKLLTESICPVHIHHINLINTTNRHEKEKEACDNIIRWFQRDYKFEYTESTIDCRHLGRVVLSDMFYYKFIAGTICKGDPAITHVAYGVTKEDFEGNDSLEGTIESSNTVFKIVGGGTVETMRPVGHMCKSEIYEMLPEELRELFWSCRKPSVDGSACGRCKTCKQLQIILNA